MAAKRQQELIIQNLRSISAEVRARSLRQLAQIPTIPQGEKLTYFQNALKDGDEIVRQAAESLIRQFGGTLPSDRDDQLIDSDELQTEPSGQVEGETPADSAQQPSGVPDEIQPPEPAEPEQPPPESDSQSQHRQESQEARHKTADAYTTADYTVPDDPVDPSLPDPALMKSIPELLDYIKTLTVKRPSGYLTYILRMAAHNIEEVALTALQSLLNLKDPRVPEIILKMLAVPGFSSQRRFLILKIIMETKSVMEIESLKEILLAEKDVIVKSGLVKVFARASLGREIGTLKICLSDPDPRVRANTIEVIEEQKVVGCDNEIKALLDDPENRVKVNAAKYLVKTGHMEAFSTLKAMLTSQEVWLRDSVIFALGEIGDQPSLTLLKAALKDPNQGIRLSVLKALAKINNAPARDVLQTSGDDADPVVAQVAKGLWDKIKNTPLQSVPQTKEAHQAKPAEPSRQPEAPGFILPSLDADSSAPGPRVATPQQPVTPEKLAPHAEPAVSAPVIAEDPNTAAPAFEIPSIDEIKREPAETQVKLSPDMPEEPAQPSKPVEKPLLDKKSQLESEINLSLQELIAPRPPTPASDPDIRPEVPPATAKITPQEAPDQTEAEATSIDGIQFQKARSVGIYKKLCSDNPDDNQKAIKDLPFIIGDDQNILLEIAVKSSNETVRLTAARIISRKRTPQMRDLLQTLADDPNELVRSFVEKALTIMK